MKIAVVGSGIWGACSAYYLNKAGADVELYDMWGAGNSRSGSGGASRIIRLTYGDDKIYTELTNNSFSFWEKLSEESERKLAIDFWDTPKVIDWYRIIKPSFPSISPKNKIPQERRLPRFVGCGKVVIKNIV